SDQKRLAEMHQEWLAAGENCGPLNRRFVSDIVAEHYYHIGRPAPRVLFFTSPAACLLAAALTTPRNRWGRLKGKLTPPFAQIWEHLPAQLESQVDRKTLDEGGLRTSVDVGLKCAISQLTQEVASEIKKAILRHMDAALYETLCGQSRWNCPIH